MIERFWELDALRGIAIISMISFHFLFDIDYFGIAAIGISSPFWQAIARIIASIFILVSGTCLSISFSKKPSFQKFFSRGMKLFFSGLIITIVSFFFIPKKFIAFGILHFIGIGAALSYPLLKMWEKNPKSILISGILCIAMGFFLQNFRFDFPWLLWLGFMPKNFSTLDYFPIFPWFGVLLIGIFIGKKAYEKDKRKFEFVEIGKKNLTAKFLAFLGKHSLAIYFLHQLVLLAIIKFVWGKGII